MTGDESIDTHKNMSDRCKVEIERGGKQQKIVWLWLMIVWLWLTLLKWDEDNLGGQWGTAGSSMV
jgi:hypothetical protein